RHRHLHRFPAPVHRGAGPRRAQGLSRPLARNRRYCGMRMVLPSRYYCRYPFEAPRGLVDTMEEIDLAHTAFLLVDVYGLGHDPGDPVPEFPPLFLKQLHLRQGEMIRASIRPALDAARRHGLPVVYTENKWRPSAWRRSEFGQL